jgi:hypothetical protein
MYEHILYLNFYVKSEKTFQRSFKHLNVKKLVHNVLTFYRFNKHGPHCGCWNLVFMYVIKINLLSWTTISLIKYNFTSDIK